MTESEPCKIIVRDARPEDSDAIIAFNTSLAAETEGKTLDLLVLTAGVATALAEPDRLRYWVAEVDGKVVGQSAITREWSDWRAGWIWWFQSVYVRADHRGRGVFRAIHAHIRDRAREESDVIGLRLYVEDENDKAQRAYQSLGFSAGGYHVYEEIWPERFRR